MVWGLLAMMEPDTLRADVMLLKRYNTHACASMRSKLESVLRTQDKVTAQATRRCSARLSYYHACTCTIDTAQHMLHSFQPHVVMHDVMP